VTLSSQLSSTRIEIESTARQIEAIKAKAEQYRRRIEATPTVEKAYNALILERNNTQAKFNDLTAKFMESQVAHGLERERKGERFTIIDPARFPERPVKPNRLAILLIGVVFGIGAGVGFAALREFSDRSVRDVKRLALATPYPVLAGIPIIETKADISRRRLKTALVSAAVVIIVAGGLIAFHNLVMDLNILWTRITLRLNLFV
jgi:capsular polysaccharide biosynthesis protein